MRFYEIHAKSALNRVPEASRMPFRWTINPYRGCSHACVYCLAGETPILMADGRTRPLAELRVGDEIYGTEQEGTTYRRYVRTRVRAHWSSEKPAYRVTLQDGTEVVASADHRFLTNRGWKHVLRADQGATPRPYLTRSVSLLGPGRFVTPPIDTPNYRRGYLCGALRGDAQEPEARGRAAAYLASAGIEGGLAGLSPVGVATSRRRRTPGALLRAERIEAMIAWPFMPTDDWRKVPRRHLRCRRQLRQRRPADRQRRPDHPVLGRGLPPILRLRLRRRASGRAWRAARARAWRCPRAAALLPSHRSGSDVEVRAGGSAGEVQRRPRRRRN